jgi:DNA-binding CsgD family transcriptional regulator
MTFFQAWICAVNSAPIVAQEANNLVLRVTHTGGILVVLLLVILCRRWVARRISGRPFAVAVTVVAVAGTLVVESSYLVDALPGVVAILGSLLTASATGAFLVAWGEGYVNIPRRTDQAKATMLALPASFVVYLLVTTFPVSLSFVVVSALPVGIAACLWWVISAKADAGPKGSEATDFGLPLSASPRPTSANRLNGLPDRTLFRLMLYIAIISVPLNYLGIFLEEQLGVVGHELWQAVYSIALFIFVGALLLETMLKKRPVTVLPTFVVILITAGLLFRFFLDSPFLAIMSFMTSGYTLFVALFYCYLGANTLLGKRAPFLVFAFGNCANTAGQVLGWLIGLFTGALFAPLASYVAVGIVYVVLVVGLFLLPLKRNFFSGDAGPEDGVGETEARGKAENTPATSVFVDGVRSQCLLLATAHALSDREGQILEYLVRGRSLETIATEINLSRNTVKTHTEHIYHKLNVHTREELIIRLEAVSENDPPNG